MFNIYLISSEVNGQLLHKIGYTRRSVEKRIKEFKTGNASEFLIVDSFQSKWGTKIESQLHRIFKPKKVSGEWFLLTDDDVKKFKEYCITTHDNFELISTQNTYYIDRGDF
jgi:hypothetical protein